MIHSILMKAGQRPSVLIGHSDRRKCFRETSAAVNCTIHAAYEYRIRPFMAIKESSSERDQRKQSKTGDALTDELRFGLFNSGSIAINSSINFHPGQSG